MLTSIRLKSDLSNGDIGECYPNGTDGSNGQARVPKIKDVLGEARPRIGPYKKLDNTKQVVALIDDVRPPFHLPCGHGPINKSHNE